MAVYKVIQDIEAEDKLLGPLTLKGFIYAAIAGVLAFINFRLLITTGLGPLRWLFMLLFSLPMILFGVLASPLGRDQPTEVWLLSHVRFLIKPRKRFWDQSGISQLVTITVPKKVERQLTKGLSQSEVNSRLQALAQTLDTRGWAVKNVSVNLSPAAQYLEPAETSSDRLIDASVMTQDAPVIDVHASDDILDEQNNPTAQKFDQLIKQAAEDRKKGVLDRLKSLVEHSHQDDKKIKNKKHKPVKKPSWLMNETTSRQIKALQLQRYEKNHADPELGDRLSKARQVFKNQHVGGSSGEQKPPVTASNRAANMELAQSGNAFSVATLQNMANRKSQVQQTGPNEVTISLH